MKKIIVATVLAAAVVSTAEAAIQDSPHFKAADINGAGCPAGSFTVAGEGSSTLKVAFKQFDAARPGAQAASGLERSACSFAVPVRVPPGYQVFVAAEWKGQAKGSVELFRRYFFAGQPQPGKSSTPSGRYAERDNLKQAGY